MLLIQSVKTVESRKAQYVKIMKAAGVNWKEIMAFEMMPVKSFPGIQTTLFKISVSNENVVMEISDEYEEQLLGVVADNAELILTTAKTFFVALKQLLKSVANIQQTWEKKTVQELEENKTEEKINRWVKTWHPFQ